MPLVRLAIQRPIAVLSVVLMIVLMGWVALNTIPIQLAPDVRRPVVTVWTRWSGSAPAEVEREIVQRQEEALKGLAGLERMESWSRNGSGRISLEFATGQNIDRILLLINNRLTQVNGLPDEATEPRIRTRDTEDSPIAWFVVQTLPDNGRNVRTYGDFIEDVVQDRMERLSGVALVNVWGGDQRELRVVVDPTKMARYGLTIQEVVDALRGTSVNISAGDVDEGKRSYVVRTEGELNTLDKVRAVPLRTRVDDTTGRISRLTVGELAEVAFGFKKRTARIRNLGKEAIVVNVIRDTGTNVMEVMRTIRALTAELNAGPLKSAGLVLEQVYDETTYIDSAISLVTQNIWVGGTLAALVLMIFLRSIGATLVIALAIPVSVIGAFVAMAALGRSINVISLAGIAFAVGMVVDAAIVVLENIFRLRQSGLSRFDAAFRGATQVWGAVLVSALTTVVVFAPVLVMNLVVGQLFRDIAVALSVAVLLSLIVSITVIPALANRLLGEGVVEASSRRRIPILDHGARLFMAAVTAYARHIVTRRSLAVVTVVVVCGITGFATWKYLPQLEYLPEGNRNLVIAITQPPPGYNLATSTRIAEKAEAVVRKHWASETGPESAPGAPPKMDRFWFIARGAANFVAASAVDPTRAGELIPVLRKAAFGEPGTFGFVSQTSLFGRHLGGGRVIDLDITGPDLDGLIDVAREVVRRIGRAMPASAGNQVRPRPGLELGSPEVRVVPDLGRLADVGLNARDLGLAIDAFNNGMRAAEVTVDGRRLDLTLTGPENRISRTQGIGNLPVVTRAGTILPARALATIEVTEGPTEILHLERERVINVQVRPSKAVPLETAIETLDHEVIAPMVEAGLPAGVRLSLSGTADELRKTWDAMVVNLVVAVLIVYLVMAVLLESFVYPLIILFSVPLATAGGVAGLSVLNLFSFQALDMLTLLGFVILVGTVVNNAILLVYQTLFHVRTEAMAVADAIVEATRNRVRPIFMSTLTSTFGMLPLVLFPGAGSELYRGLGSVVIGGLALSAVLTLLIIPPLLSLVGGVAERSGARRASAGIVHKPAE